MTELSWRSALGVGAMMVVAALAWIAPGFQPLSTDDATYLVVGRNVLHGLGPERLGEPFLLHSPLFPVLLAFPGRLLGFDDPVLAHVVIVAFAAVACLLTAALARSHGREATIVAFALALATPLVASSARFLSIDTVAAVLILAAALAAVGLGRAGDDWWRAPVLTGSLIGGAVAVKETSAVFLVAALLVPAVLGGGLRVWLRDALLIVVASAAAISWWILWYAWLTGRMPYLALPGFAAIPVVGTTVGALVVIARRRATWGGGLTFRWSGLQARPAWTPLARLGLAAGVVLAGASVLTAFAVGSAPGVAESVAPSSWDVLLGRLGDAVPGWPLVLVLVAAAVAVAPADRSVAVLCLWLIAFLPVGYLTLALENGARNFLAAVLLAAALAGVLVGVLLGRATRRPAVGLASATPRAATALMIGAVIVAAAGVLRAAAAAPPPADALVAEHALRQVARGLPSQVPAGRPVVVGYLWGPQLDVFVGGSLDLRLLKPTVAYPDPASPTGLRSEDGPIGSVVGLNVHTRRGSFLVFERADVERLFQESRAGAFIYIHHGPRSPRAMVGLFVPEAGFRRVERVRLGSSRRLDRYEVLPAGVRLADQPAVMDASTLDRLLDVLTAVEPPERLASAVETLLPNGVRLWGRPHAPANVAALARLDAVLERAP